MKYKITGSVMQLVNIDLEQGETIFSESSAMVWMSENMKMDTKAKGGIMSGFGRMLSGESFFLTEFTPENGPGVISFAGEYPGKTIPVELKAGEEMIMQRDAFLCAESSMSLSMHIQKRLGAGIFGGEGFILQKLTGPGTAFVNFGGDIIQFDLEQNQKLKIDTGCIAMYEPTVTFEITRVRGVKNILFGGEGIFLATLTGPGKVWLQSMPINTLAAKIAQFIVPKN